MNSLSFTDWAKQTQHQMEMVLEKTLPLVNEEPYKLNQAMSYATLDGGKRVRPLLAHATAALFDSNAEAVECVAAAVEMIHAYSLVHDDLPAMDNDVLRRGKPTCHIQFDEATALLAGDALQTQAFIVLANAPLAPSQAIEALKLLAFASGAKGMAGGQAIDLASVGIALSLESLQQMHQMKTGALIRAAVLLGAYCQKDGILPDSNTLSALSSYAEKIGLAFQVVDDILDVEADSATLGKTAGKDAAADKPTYVSLLGLAEAKEKAARLHLDALAAIEPFGEKAKRLKELADYIVLRSY
ncbi:polyprenyl synthetase family protein [Leeia sp. TBRC 13508]|uniref:Polyprenyl synthetase family protein n=1 Tax=Leeia speluncae TaxID=2884804 RepID=A0ABS8D8W6_9NEIS|nr:farnesyl diphosphate synthase [Leeia speluncae]MCB6184468.1 polyprenyl synthetase family protein [Leeia speluncae]